jgi:outer membrane protein assembly factor BamB
VNPPVGVRCLFALLVLAGGFLARADNWPRWRGPDHNGVTREAGLPAEWGEGRNLAWTLPLPGMGASTPAVWQDHIFLTSEDGGNVVLLCAGTDGKERWRRPLASGRIRVRRDEGNGASSSPSTDGRHVWAFAHTGDLACFDFDGKEVWRFNAQQRYGKFDIQFGMHTTPLLYQDRLYLQLLHSGGAWVVALDKATGKEVWKVERKSDARDECEHSYASPVLWQNGKDAYLITHGNDYAVAHRLEDGSEIWRVGGLNPPDNYDSTLRFVASPVATPDLIVVPSAKRGPVVGVDPGARGLVLPGSRYERWHLLKSTPDVSSPLVYDGLVYLCHQEGFLYCLDPRTGKQHYRQRLHPARYRASPVGGDGKVYLTARDGVVTVVKAGPTFEVLAENKLPDQISASPAVADGRIYLRGFTALYAIGNGKK